MSSSRREFILAGPLSFENCSFHLYGCIPYFLKIKKYSYIFENASPDVFKNHFNLRFFELYPKLKKKSVGDASPNIIWMYLEMHLWNISTHNCGVFIRTKGSDIICWIMRTSINIELRATHEWERYHIFILLVKVWKHKKGGLELGFLKQKLFTNSRTTHKH